MEDLVDRVQRYNLKPDKALEEEIKHLKKLRDQVFDDLQTFVREREKHHWREWDRYKYENDEKPHLRMGRTIH